MPPADVNALFGQLQTVIEELLGADPLSVSALEEDPITASLLADLEKELGAGEQDLLHEMQRLGVLRSGATVDQFERLRGDYGRTRLDVLSDAAKRADERRMGGLTRGTDLGELLSGREIDIAKLMGEFGGDQTLGGREADLGLLASIISSLDPSLDINKNTLAALIDTIFSGMGGGGFDTEAIEALRAMIQGQGGTGFGLEEELTTANGEITGGDISGKWAEFRADNPDLANNSRIKVNYYTDRPGEARDMSTGQLVARYNEATGKWERT